MEFVINSLIDIVNTICFGFMKLFTGDIWYNFMIPDPVADSNHTWRFGDSPLSPNETGWFDKYLPGVTFLKSTFKAMGYFIAVMLMLLGLLRSLLPDTPASKAAHPGYVVGRFFIASIMCYYAYALIQIIQSPMAALCKYVVEKKEQSELLGGDIKSLPTEGDIELSGVDGEDASFVQGFLVCFLTVTLTIVFFKLVMEMVERFVVAGFLFYASPLALATTASEGTSGIAKSYFQMLISQYILLMFNFMILYVFIAAIANIKIDNIKSGQDLFFVYVILISWVRLGARVDDILKSLGLSAVQTGGGLGRELLAGAGTTMAAFKTAKGVAKSGFRASQGAVRAGKEVGGAMQSAAASSGLSKKTADEASNNLGIDRGSIENASKDRDGSMHIRGTDGATLNAHANGTSAANKASAGDHVNTGTHTVPMTPDNRNTTMAQQLRGDPAIQSELINKYGAENVTPISDYKIGKGTEAHAVNGFKVTDSKGNQFVAYSQQGNQAFTNAVNNHNTTASKGDRLGSTSRTIDDGKGRKLNVQIVQTHKAKNTPE